MDKHSFVNHPETVKLENIKKEFREFQPARANLSFHHDILRRDFGFCYYHDGHFNAYFRIATRHKIHYLVWNRLDEEIGFPIGVYIPISPELETFLLLKYGQ